MELKTSEGMRGARIAFPREVSNQAETRTALVEMVQQAREAGKTGLLLVHLPNIIRGGMLELSSNPRRSALAIAILADALQIVFLPMFVEGVSSPLDDLLDIAVAWVLIRLLGWHWAFLPSFAAKLVPGVDLVPTWTMAVLVATRKAPREQPKIQPPIIEGRP